MVTLSISNEVLAEIGKITVVFNYIEDSLGEIISKIVTVGGRPRALGQIVTAELSFGQRIAILDSLLLFALGKDHECIVEFAQVKPLLFRAEQQRNTVVHSVWAHSADGEEPAVIVRMKSTAKQKRGLRIDFVRMGLEALRRVTCTLGEALIQLYRFELHFQEEAHAPDLGGDRPSSP